MRKILITGARGYIGSYLLEYFTESEDCQVYGTSRKNEDVVNDKRFRYLDLLDDTSFDGICKDVDIVIHTATMDERKIKSDGKSALIMNAYGTRQLFLQAMNEGVRKFIYLSTFHVYGRNCGFIDELTPVSPISDYGLTHYFAEQYLRQLSVNSTCEVDVLRLTNGVGTPLANVDKWYLVLNDFCKSAFERQEIVLKSNGLPLRDFVSINDILSAVDILINCKSQNKYNIYNLSSQIAISIRELAELVAELYYKKCGKKCELNIPAVSEQEKNAVEGLFVSSKKMRDLGWNTFETLEMTINDILEDLVV